MINRGDFLFVYRNGEFDGIDIAGAPRGFLGRDIYVGTSDGTKLIDRVTGKFHIYEAKVVPKDEWDAKAAEMDEQERQARLLEEQKQLKQEALNEALGEKAEEWFKTLPKEQQDMVHALVWKWRPIPFA